MSSSRKDGRQVYCKQCVSDRNALNREKRLTRAKEYYVANKEEIARKARELYVANRQICLERAKKYRDSNKERVNQNSRNYYLQNKDKFVRYKENNREKIRLRLKSYRENNIKLLLKLEEIYRINNRESIAEKARRYYHANKHKCNKRLNDYRRSNPEKFTHLNAKRRASKLKATPPWLTKEDFTLIEELFMCARLFRLYTGEEYHVDHIVPLQGKNVCGLHVPWNLQVISAKENLIKSNKFDIESKIWNFQP